MKVKIEDVLLVAAYQDSFKNDQGQDQAYFQMQVQEGGSGGRVELTTIGIPSKHKDVLPKLQSAIGKRISVYVEVRAQATRGGAVAKFSLFDEDSVKITAAKAA